MTKEYVAAWIIADRYLNGELHVPAEARRNRNEFAKFIGNEVRKLAKSFVC